MTPDYSKYSIAQLKQIYRNDKSLDIEAKELLRLAIRLKEMKQSESFAIYDEEN